MQVGVRELKQNLSAYLDRVARGEVVTVTDRGVPKALLSPFVESGQLERGIEEGWVRPSNGRPLGAVRRAKGLSQSLDALDQDRAE